MRTSDLYRQMHALSPRTFSGYTCARYSERIGALVRETGAQRLLDYGSGKGYQYLERRIHEQWGVPLPYCYDPGVPQLSRLPEGPFDGALCCDVLEHLEQSEIADALAELSARVRPEGFVFLTVCCRPAEKRLPDGRNAHLTVRPESWWRTVVSERCERRVEMEFTP